MNAVVSNSMDGKDYGEGMDNAIGRALIAVGVLLEGAAVRNANFTQGYQTGRTKGSITYATKKKRTYPSGNASITDGVSEPSDEYTVNIGTNVEYAPHLEYGTVRMAAQPFLRPALNDNRGRVEQVFHQEIKKGLQDGR